MSKVVCSVCHQVHENIEDGECPVDKAHKNYAYDFKNSDEFLINEVAKILEYRRSTRLDGLVGGLQAIIINTETEKQKPAVQELLNFTGYEYETTISDESFITAILKLKNSADILVRSRKKALNPFKQFNLHPKSG